MSLFSRLFSHPNPTEHFRREVSKLEVDLDESTFCGVRPGTDLEGFHRLGTGVYTKGKSAAVLYKTQGFQLYVDAHGIVESIDINLLAEQDWSAYSGCWRHQGNLVDLSVTDKPQNVESLLGAAHESTDEPGGTWLKYVRRSGTIEFEWGEAGLENVMLSSRSESR